MAIHWLPPVDRGFRWWWLHSSSSSSNASLLFQEIVALREKAGGDNAVPPLGPQPYPELTAGMEVYAVDERCWTKPKGREVSWTLGTVTRDHLTSTDINCLVSSRRGDHIFLLLLNSILCFSVLLSVCIPEVWLLSHAWRLLLHLSNVFLDLWSILRM